MLSENLNREKIKILEDINSNLRSRLTILDLTFKELSQSQKQDLSIFMEENEKFEEELLKKEKKIEKQNLKIRQIKENIQKNESNLQEIIYVLEKKEKRVCDLKQQILNEREKLKIEKQIKSKKILNTLEEQAIQIQTLSSQINIKKNLNKEVKIKIDDYKKNEKPILTKDVANRLKKFVLKSTIQKEHHLKKKEEEKNHEMNQLNVTITSINTISIRDINIVMDQNVEISTLKSGNQISENINFSDNEEKNIFNQSLSKDKINLDEEENSTKKFNLSKTINTSKNIKIFNNAPKSSAKKEISKILKIKTEEKELKEEKMNFINEQEKSKREIQIIEKKTCFIKISEFWNNLFSDFGCFSEF